MSVIVIIDKSQVRSEFQTQDLQVDVSFIGLPFGFNMTDFEAKPLGCNLDDSTWELPLPKLSDPNAQNVEIAMLTETELFSF